MDGINFWKITEHFFSEKAEEINKDSYRLPDEIVKIIIHYAPWKARNTILPQVSRQYYNLTLSYASAFRRLCKLIPKVKEAVAHRSLEFTSNFIALSFSENQEVSILKICTLDTRNQIPCQTYQVALELVLKQRGSGKFFHEDFTVQMNNLAHTHLYSDVKARKISYNENINNFTDKNSDYLGFQLIAGCILELDHSSLIRVAKVLIDFSQKILLNGDCTLMQLKGMFENGLDEDGLNVLKGCYKLITNKFGQSIDVVLPDYQKLLEDNKSRFLDFVSIPQDKLIIAIREYLTEWVKDFGARPRSSNTLFFLDKVTGIVSQNTLHQFVLPNMQHKEEHLWFAHRVFPNAQPYKSVV